MIKTIFSLSLVFCSFIAFTQQNNFKYKGELPTDKFVLISTDIIIPSAAKANAIEPRNRIYLMLHDDNTLTINNHKVVFKDLDIHFKYILTNPDKHEHLPESPRKAVIFTNLYDTNQQIEDDVELFKRSMVILKIVKFYTALQEQEMHNLLSTSWEEIRYRETEYIMELTPQYAITKTEYEAVEEVDATEEVIEMPEIEQEEVEKPLLLKERNYCKILVSNNQVMVRKEVMTLEEMKVYVKEFITNPNQKENFAEQPVNACINLTRTKTVDFDLYTTVYRNLRAVYSEIWNDVAMNRFGTNYENLNDKIQKDIRTEFPLVIFENEQE